MSLIRLLAQMLAKLLGGGEPPERRRHSVPERPEPRRPAAPPPKPKILKLDVEQFRPLSSDEARRQARGVGSVWTNPWSMRRDRIPPMGDGLTRVIDGAMVGRGLISAEELAEIHGVGEEMDRVRPDLAVAGQRADDAVAQSREAHAERKRQLKEAAEVRRTQRAEAIAQRKRTDIVFLGRGVSRGLADRRADIEKLEAGGLPVLATPADVAATLGIDIPTLRWLAFHNEAARRVHYVSFEVEKRSGGKRRLHAPHRKLARCQEIILRGILDKLPASDAAHGFVTGRSTVTNATPHAGHDVLVNADLRDFFPTITFPRVCGAFAMLGYSPAVATILALLCTEAPRRAVTFRGETLHVATGPRALPQGACASPALSNLIARRMDARLTGIAGKLGWTYTRYADDLSFSASGAAGELTGYLLARVRHIAQDEGFAVNEKKTRVLRRNAAQSVTGVVVNERPGVPRKLVRRMRAILHRARFNGLEAENRDGHPHFEAWVRGMIAYVSMVNAEQGARLRTAFERLGPRA